MRGLLLAVTVLAAGCLDALPTTLDPSPPPPPRPEGTLEVHYVDVGQGDGTVWRFPDGTVVVYDCGETVAQGAFSPMVAQLQALGVARIHALVVSHGHADHAGGCLDVLEAFDVATVVDGWYGGEDATRTYEAFKAAAVAEGARLLTLRDAPGATTVRAGDEVPLPASAGGRIDLLWPLGPVADTWDDIADESLVARLVFGDVAFCFQGDIGPTQEAALARSARAPTCDAYLAGHHGSRAASTATWLARMDPEVAVVSFGENPYGHPAPDALCRMQQAGAALYFTHRSGTVTLTTDGRTLSASAGAETGDYCGEGADYWVPNV